MRPVRVLLLLALLWCAPALADLVVVVNPQNSTEQLSRSQIINIFLGNNREYPNGLVAKPVDLPNASSERALFYRGLVNKDIDQMAAYSSRLVFAGNTTPPQALSNGQEVLQLIESNRNAIGYVERKNAEAARVKVVFTLP